MSYWSKRTMGPIQAIHPMTGKIIEVDPQKDCKIGGDLSRELRLLPGTLAWYLSLRDVAETAYREARHHEHNVEEDLYGAVRKVAGKGTTETVVKMMVKRDPNMRAAYRKRMDAETMLRHLKSAVEAIQEKRWSLQALAKLEAFERGVRDNA